ncbi:MAG: hypothetical protein R2795_11860 [Saprospiraceae bacterium]
MIDELFGWDFERRRLSHHESNLLREQALMPLHATQVRLLRQWRTQRQEGLSDAITEQTLLTLLISIMRLLVR